MYQNNSAVLYGIVGERFAENGKLIDNPMLSLLGFYNAGSAAKIYPLRTRCSIRSYRSQQRCIRVVVFLRAQNRIFKKCRHTRTQDTVYHRKNDCDVPLRHIDGTDPPLSQRPACQRNAAGLSAGGQLRRLYAHRLRRIFGLTFTIQPLCCTSPCSYF